MDRENITDWYLFANNPLQGFVYPHSESIQDNPALHHQAILLTAQCVERHQAGNNEFLLHDGGQIYRGHSLESVDGWMYILRRIPKDIPKMDDLKMPSAIRDLLLHPRLSAGGLVIITGETGQGKSTTCAATIRARLEKFGSFCLTIEDPPEFSLNGKIGSEGRCVQTEVQSGNFAKALHGAMRCYPAKSGSILYVGETRDSETAGEVLRAAGNGHLVFTTMHGLNIITAIKRFISFATAQQSSSEADVKMALATSLRMVLHQRLVPSLSIPGQPVKKRLDINFIISKDGTTPIAQRIKGNVDTLSSDIEMQKTALDVGGANGVLKLWEH